MTYSYYYSYARIIIHISYSYYYHHTIIILILLLPPPSYFTFPIMFTLPPPSPIFPYLPLSPPYPSRTKLSSLISGITPPTTPLISFISLLSPPISMYFTAAATVALTSASRDTNLLFISGTNTDGLTNDNRPTHSETTLRVPSSCDWLLRKRVDQMGRARGERREEDDWRII